MKDATVDAAEQEVARLAAEVAREMRPGAGARQVAADASLERDLGLDSLGRAELMARLERTFAVRLPEEVLASAETPAQHSRSHRESFSTRMPQGLDGKIGILHGQVVLQIFDLHHGAAVAGEGQGVTEHAHASVSSITLRMRPA